tara:strand:+ start:446 stop:754 length:309 start_codon:yes stop_codon:yes gene_type:complete
MLEKFYKENPGKLLNGKVYNAKEDNTLNSLQVAHMRKEISLYAPVEAYTEKWSHRFNKETEQFIEAHPVSGTRKRNDLPPIAVQWQQEFRKRNKNGKSSGRR